MRLRQRDLKPYVVKRRIEVKEPDATTSEDWGCPVTIKANILPAGGKSMAELYGERLAYMLTAYAENTRDVMKLTEDMNSKGESFGVCIYASEPDYRIVAIRPWASHKVIDLEAIR